MCGGGGGGRVEVGEDMGGGGGGGGGRGVSEYSVFKALWRGVDPPLTWPGNCSPQKQNLLKAESPKISVMASHGCSFDIIRCLYRKHELI